MSDGFGARTAAVPPQVARPGVLDDVPTVAHATRVPPACHLGGCIAVAYGVSEGAQEIRVGAKCASDLR